jgi:hypothetical protein
MNRLGVGWRMWAGALCLVTVGCGGSSEQTGNGGGAGNGGAGPGGASTGGTAGAAGSAAGMATGGTTKGGATTGGATTGGATTGGATTGGSGGSTSGGTGGSAGQGGVSGGGAAPCNDLALNQLDPTCSELATLPTGQGGPIVVGTYALSEYEVAGCLFDLEQTLRIELAASDTYDVQTVVNVGGGARSNAVMVRSGNELRSTSTCNGSDDNSLFGYSAYEEQEQDYITLIRDGYGVFTYRKVAD